MHELNDINSIEDHLPLPTAIKPIGTKVRSFRLPREWVQHQIFTVNDYKDLRGLHKTDEDCILRYLIDTGCEILFAPEGVEVAHYKMTGEDFKSAYCLTAGNVILTADFSTIVKITNKSGDFRPDKNTLAIALLYFTHMHLNNKVVLADPLYLEANYDKEQSSYQIPLDVCIAYYNRCMSNSSQSYLSPNRIELVNQRTKRLVQYGCEPLVDKTTSSISAHVSHLNLTDEKTENTQTNASPKPNRLSLLFAVPESPEITMSASSLPVTPR